MKKIYFTPGPSQLFYTVEEHMKEAMKQQIGSISHREQKFKDLYKHTVDELRTLLGLPDDYHIIFTTSATEVWERIIDNCVKHKSGHLINGAFSSKFASTAKLLGVEVEEIVAQEGAAVSIEDIRFSKDVELIGLAHNETSTGATQPLEDIDRLRTQYPDALIAVDVVSSIPYVSLDYSKIDMAYFSVQKCFGLPAGLGVWMINDRAIARAQEIEDHGRKQAAYRQLSNLVSEGLKFQTTSTPNVLDIYLLGKVAEDMNYKGLDLIRRETEYKSAVLYQCINDHPNLEPFIKDTRFQSKTTIVAKTKDGPKDIINALSKLGLMIGGGYGKYKTEHIRIANFPTHSKEQIELLVDELNKL